jgi:hypothetical protein
MTNLRAPEDSTLRVQGLPTAENRWQVQCLNCEAPLHGVFCSSCGQRAAPPHPTVREIAGDAFSELSGWDGKLADTFRTLLRHPGELTRQWIDGKRVSFILPLRLYLTASVLYFIVTAGAPDLRTDGRLGGGAFNVSLTDQDGAPSRVSREMNKAIATKQALTGPERDSALAEIARAPKVLQPMMRRAVDDPAAFGTEIRRAMPNVFLALVPVLGLILALFYRRRHYPEHLFFAIHLASFIFIARTLGNLALYTHSIWAAGIAQAAMMIWIVVYGVKALRRVYGGSLPMTILKGIGICVLYAIVATPIIAGVAFLIVSR